MLIAPLADTDPFHLLRHQAVRDLAWCCLSPPLLQELSGSNAHILPLVDTNIWPWLQALDKQPAALMNALAQVKSTRLGIYYETLWRFYFTHSPQWQLLAHNFPINRGKATLGAFDFLCRHGDDYWHIETAVKFYLCDTLDPQQAQDWHHWIGPNSHDRFDLKLARLRDHQLPLHQTAEGKTALQQHFPQADHWRSGLCLQGYLFSPAPATLSINQLTSAEYIHSLPRALHSHASQALGFWWYLRDFLTLIADTKLTNAKFNWIVLEREQWFSPVQLPDVNLTIEVELLSQQLMHQLHQTKRPLMVAAVIESCLENDEKNIIWREQLRGFVVPDDWPQNHSNP